MKAFKHAVTKKKKKKALESDCVTFFVGKENMIEEQKGEIQQNVI